MENKAQRPTPVAAAMTANHRAFRAKTTPNKKRVQARRACRGRVQADA